jgi:hypothetical protein
LNQRPLGYELLANTISVDIVLRLMLRIGQIAAGDATQAQPEKWSKWPTTFVESRRLPARKLDVKRETPRVVPRSPDAPAMRLHDRATDRQPHPQPLRLGADEVLKDSL